VPDGDPSCRVFSSYLPGVLACRRRRRAPPSGVAARCRTVTRPAGFFLPTCPESWRAAGGGAPRLVGWLPGAGRWPGPPGLFFLRVMACRRRRRALPGGVAARCRTVTRAAGVILPACHGVPPEAARPARWGGCPVPDGDPSCRVFSSYLPGVLACRRRRRALPGGVAARCRTVARAAGFILPTSHGVPPEAARPARWGGCPVPDGGPPCPLLALGLL